MAEERATNITWHGGQVAREDRERLQGHRAGVLWFTGLSGSGKSTLAHAVEAELHRRGCRTYVLDGDNVRHGLCRDLGFTPEERAENLRRIAEVAKLFLDAGVLTLAAFISPYQRERAHVRGIVGSGFHEIYVQADLGVCEARDPKGLYQKARAGEIAHFTGVTDPYEPPEQPELAVDTSAASLEACTEAVLAYLEAQGIVPRA